MTIPTINAFINFSTGPSFAQAMILDQGILDTNVLADAAAVIVDISNVVVNTGATLADENTIVDAVQAALNEIARRGYLTTYAGALPA